MHKILLVDDEERIREILAKFLTQMGFEIIEAPGGREAIDILKQNVNIDLVIMDMKMPKVSGTDVLQELKNLNKVFPVILLTGSIDAEPYLAGLKGLDFKHEDICYKPVDFFVLLDLVKKRLGVA